MQFSVIICAHNPRSDYLGRALRALREQTFPMSKWELLLVDNRSSRLLSTQIDLSWHPHGNHVREETLGLTSARLRGIESAQGELLIFVDDDNLLVADYLASALEICREYPWIGTFGACTITPEYEVQPSIDLEPYCSLLALRNEPCDRFANLPKVESAAVPFGAGLCVKAQVAKNLARKKRQGGRVFDRKGTDLFSSGDLEFSLAAVDSGLGYGIFRRLRLTHLIPSGRVQLEYLLRLNESLVYSNDLLNRLRRRELGEKPRSTVREFAMAVNILIRTLSAKGVDRQFQWKSGRGRIKALREFRSTPAENPLAKNLAASRP